MESISAQIMDLHTDVADLDAKECFLDRMIEGCRAELKNLTEDSEVAKYPFSLFHLLILYWLRFTLFDLSLLKSGAVASF